MRTLQVRVVCDRCEKADFYDMPIYLTDPISSKHSSATFSVPYKNKHDGPLGWKMTYDKCYCSIECQAGADIKADKADGIFKQQSIYAEDAVSKKYVDDPLDWKTWQEYCNDVARTTRQAEAVDALPQTRAPAIEFGATITRTTTTPIMPNIDFYDLLKR